MNVIFDQVGTPTYAKDLAKAIMSIIQSQEFNQTDFKTNIVHFSNEGVCSWYDFAKTIFELTNIQCQVTPIETKDYPTPATRPYFSVLNKAKIKKTYHLTIPYWKDSFKQCLTALQEKLMKTILVTGGAGFIGSAVIRHLINDTDSIVVNVDKLTYAGNLESLLNSVINSRHFEQVDICDANVKCSRINNISTISFI